MIELKDLYKVYNKAKPSQVVAINKLNFNVQEAEYVVVVGANGSGKSTLLNLIAGSILPSSGSITINRQQVTTLPDYKRSQWIARVFQNPLSGTAPDLSILDNFRLAALRTKRKSFVVGTNDFFRKSVQDKVQLLHMGLENKLNQPMGTLSGGQRQALTLLMSTMDDCRILLMDEPTAALDPRSAELVMQTANEIVRNFKLTAILITHQLKDAYNYGNRLVMMEEGQIIKDYSGENKLILTQHDLFEWFS